MFRPTPVRSKESIINSTLEQEGGLGDLLMCLWDLLTLISYSNKTCAALLWGLSQPTPSTNFWTHGPISPQFEGGISLEDTEVHVTFSKSVMMSSGGLFGLPAGECTLKMWTWWWSSACVPTAGKQLRCSILSGAAATSQGATKG